MIKKTAVCFFFISLTLFIGVLFGHEKLPEEKVFFVLDKSKVKKIQNEEIKKEQILSKQEITEKTIMPEKTQDVFEIRILKTDCEKLRAKALMKKEAYVAGLNVYGQKVVSAQYQPDENVVSADIDDNEMSEIKKSLKEKTDEMIFSFNLVLKKPHLYHLATLESSDIRIVDVAVKNGKVFLNGISLSPEDEKNLEKACLNLNDASVPTMN